MEPIVLFSDMGISARNFLHRVRPQRRWLINRSATLMLSASHGDVSITSAAALSPLAMRRLSSARAKRTSFARSSARLYCGAQAIVADAFINVLSPSFAAHERPAVDLTQTHAAAPARPRTQPAYTGRLVSCRLTLDPSAVASDAWSSYVTPGAAVNVNLRRRCARSDVFLAGNPCAELDNREPATRSRSAQRRGVRDGRDVVAGLGIRHARASVLGGARRGVPGSGEGPMLGLERRLDGGEGGQRPLKGVAIVGGHHAGAQERAAGRHGRMHGNVGEHPRVVESAPQKRRLPIVAHHDG